MEIQLEEIVERILLRRTHLQIIIQRILEEVVRLTTVRLQILRPAQRLVGQAIIQVVSQDQVAEALQAHFLGVAAAVHLQEVAEDAKNIYI